MEKRLKINTEEDTDGVNSDDTVIIIIIIIFIISDDYKW